MAINIFKSVTEELNTGGTVLYTAPVGYSSIVLLAQVSNITNQTQFVDVQVRSDDSAPPTSLVTNFAIPGYDAATVLTGKLVLESGQNLFARANANGSLQVVLSILETQI